MTTLSIESLTPREREVLTLIAEGDSLAEIAQKLSRSLKTIESHRLSLGRKLKASNRVELAHIAIAAGLVSVKTDEAASASASTAGMAQTELAWLQQINEAVFNATGATFIKRFCDAASLLPGINIAAVCTPDPTLAIAANPYHRYVIAISNRGVANDPIRYHATGTPCETIIHEGECCFSNGVAQAYPGDAWLQELKAEGYLGIQLAAEDGTACGGIGLIGREPIQNIEAYRSVLNFFAPRLAAELKLCLEFNTLRTRCELLENQATASANEKTDGSAPGGVPASVSPSALAIAQINTDTHSLAGPMFLRAIANSLCTRLGLKSTGICMFTKRPADAEIVSVVYSIDGQTGENFSYKPIDIPCEKTIEDEFYCLPKQARQTYPNATYFHEMGIDAYIGILLKDGQGSRAGVFWVCQTHEMTDPDTIQHVMEHFAPRIGAEVARFQQMEELLLEQEKLKRELSSRPGKAKSSV